MERILVSYEGKKYWWVYTESEYMILINVQNGVIEKVSLSSRYIDEKYKKVTVIDSRYVGGSLA